LTIVKMRGGNHSKDIREYEITSEGLKIGDRLQDYRGLVTGVPERMDLSEGKTNAPPR
jgi:circadian clock protein KaiC